MSEYSPRENFEIQRPDEFRADESYRTDRRYIKYLEEQNKQMLRTLKRVYFEECNSDSCDNCPVVGSCVFQELKDTIESITGKKIEEENDRWQRAIGTITQKN